MADELEGVLTDLVITNRILAHEAVLDDFGHVAVRHPGRADRFFVSRSRSPELVTRDDILEMTLDGEAIDAGGRHPYAESIIHARIFAARPDVQATVHHHCAAILPFAASGVVLRPVYHMGAVLGGPVPSWDSRPEFGDTNMLVDDAHRADSLARALGANSAVMMCNHGATCAADSLRAVTFVAVRMKVNAEVQAAAMTHGEVRYLTPGEIAAAAAMLMQDLSQERAWSYWRARAGFAGI